MLSAAENVEYPLLQFKELTASKRQERIIKFLDIVGLQAFAHHRPNQLSGGQRQLVLIARAICQSAKIFIMDEPAANLDYANH